MWSPTRSRLCALAVGAVAVATLSFWPAGHSPAAPKPESDPVRPLLKDRVELLVKIHEVARQTYKGGQASLAEVLSAQTALLNGKLDLCETRAARVEVHGAMVTVAEEMVQAVQKLVLASQATRVELLKAEVQLLEARIGLERAKAAK